jgi:hypothetical protein
VDPIVLDNIPFQLDVESLATSMRARPGTSSYKNLMQLAATAQAIGKPKAYYRMAFVEAKGDNHVIVDGVRLSSRILRVNLEQAHRVFVYVITSGQELEAWATSFTGDLLQRFWADALAEAVLRRAVEFFRSHLDERYQPGQTSQMNPGSLPDWPITEQGPLFSILGDVRQAIGVQLTNSFLMLPRKSVSGIDFPTETTFASCQLCPREHCPNRRARYDPTLYTHYLPAASTPAPVSR